MNRSSFCLLKDQTYFCHTYFISFAFYHKGQQSLFDGIGKMTYCNNQIIYKVIIELLRHFLNVLCLTLWRDEQNTLNNKTDNTEIFMIFMIVQYLIVA